MMLILLWRCKEGTCVERELARMSCCKWVQDLITIYLISLPISSRSCSTKILALFVQGLKNHSRVFHNPFQPRIKLSKIKEIDTSHSIFTSKSQTEMKSHTASSQAVSCSEHRKIARWNGGLSNERLNRNRGIWKKKKKKSRVFYPSLDKQLLDLGVFNSQGGKQPL